MKTEINSLPVEYLFTLTAQVAVGQLIPAGSQGCIIG